MHPGLKQVEEDIQIYHDDLKSVRDRLFYQGKADEGGYEMQEAYKAFCSRFGFSYQPYKEP